MQAITYTSAHADRWNNFILTANNGSFLFHRQYMEYHADRFADASLLLESRGKLVAVLPAHHREGVVCSHEGLTFGGLILRPKVNLHLVNQAVDAALQHYRSEGFQALRYNPMPFIYFQRPTQEDLACLLQRGAKLVQHKISCVASAGTQASATTQRNIRSARLSGITIAPWSNLGEFYQMLTTWLQHRHEAKPVHSLAELSLLRDRFPENILIRAAWKDGKPVSATMTFAHPTCLRLQYAACTDDGFKHHAGKAVDSHLLQSLRPGTWLDFGTSMHPSTGELNASLHLSKELLGGRTLLQNTYEIPL